MSWTVHSNTTSVCYPDTKDTQSRADLFPPNVVSSPTLFRRTPSPSPAGHPPPAGPRRAVGTQASTTSQKQRNGAHQIRGTQRAVCAASRHFARPRKSQLLGLVPAQDFHQQYRESACAARDLHLDFARYYHDQQPKPHIFSSLEVHSLGSDTLTPLADSRLPTSIVHSSIFSSRIFPRHLSLRFSLPHTSRGFQSIRSRAKGP